MNEIILQAKDLAAGYGDKMIVRDVSFSVRRGEIVVLIGPNGAGKSTILKSISKQIESKIDTVFWNGKSISKIDQFTLSKEISILTTERVRTDRMSVREVVSLGRYPYTGTLGVLSEHDREVVSETMERVGIAGLAERDFEALSDGQRQRVLLARAICQEPEALVLDEPTSYLDIRYQLELLGILHELAQEKHIAVVMSLHELTLARRVADLLVCVKDGAVDRAGTPDEIFIDKYIEDLYELPPRSFAAYFGSGAEALPPGGKAYAFFQNRACEKFPCHAGVAPEDFNCLFCYCPLYALGERCGGHFHYTEKGYKSCVDCSFPHERAHYDAVLARYPEIAALTKRTEKSDGV